jgi:hypothetical protein
MQLKSSFETRRHRRGLLTEPLLAALTFVVLAMLVAVAYLGGGPDAILAVLPVALLAGALLAGRFPGEEVLAELREALHTPSRRRVDSKPLLPRPNPLGIFLSLVLLATARALRAPPPQKATSLT